MRITNNQIAELENLIVKRGGLTLENFEVTRHDEQVTFQFRGKYFFFGITKTATDQYRVEYSTVSHKNPSTVTDEWDRLRNRFDTWANQIKSDIEVVLEHAQGRPPAFDKTEIPSMVKKLSPRFDRVFEQAYQAELAGLDEICGLGYRKAFEILIKDYLIKKEPKEEANAIRKMPITQCISRYVTDDGIRLVSSRVVWLGNDEAHYMRVYKNKTVQDMKRLIHLTIVWIDTHEQLLKLQKTAARVEKEFPRSKK